MKRALSELVQVGGRVDGLGEGSGAGALLILLQVGGLGAGAGGLLMLMQRPGQPGHSMHSPTANFQLQEGGPSAPQVSVAFKEVASEAMRQVVLTKVRLLAGYK